MGSQNARALREALEESLGHKFSQGNCVERLLNGVQIFPSMLEAIRSAQESIEFLTFVYWEGEIAREFAHALTERAKSGVRVRVLLDAFGAARIPSSLTEEMRDAGAEVCFFRPITKRHLFRLTSRTHRKVLVVDGTVGFTGGVGIASEWEGDARNPDEWRESHFRFTGQAVAGLRAAFLENWAECAGWARSSSLPEPQRDGESEALVVRSTGGSGWSDVLTTVSCLIATAQKSLTIVTAYFVPPPQIAKALHAALERGVELRVLLPGEHTDQRLCNLAGAAELRSLEQAGAKIMLYGKTMLHAKIILVDGELAMLGSPNFNGRSATEDDEVAVVVLDTKLVEVLEHDLQEDLAASAPFESSRWRDPNPWTRMKAFVARRIRSAL